MFLRSHAKGPIWFATGVVATLFLQQWFVGLLPGPTVSANVRGLRITSGNASGCTLYQISFSTIDDPVEYVSAKIEFPNQIDDFKFGYPQESLSQKSSITIAEIGRAPDGKCAIVQGLPKDSPGVQSSAAGNEVGFSATKLSDHENLIGFVVTADGRTSVTPAPALGSQGTYEYTKLGQPVKKTLSVINLGTEVTRDSPGR